MRASSKRVKALEDRSSLKHEVYLHATLINGIYHCGGKQYKSTSELPKHDNLALIKIHEDRGKREMYL